MTTTRESLTPEDGTRWASLRALGRVKKGRTVLVLEVDEDGASNRVVCSNPTDTVEMETGAV
jgi:hypothetical protein